MKKIKCSFLLYSTLSAVLFSGFVFSVSCKPANNSEKDNQDKLTEKNLIGVWKAMFTVNEGGKSIKFPYKPDPSHDVYMYVAYSPEGKVYVCAQKVDLENSTVVLGKTKEYKYSVKGNDITWSDDEGSDTISFLLKDDRFTTITKDNDGNIIVFNYKRTKNPTLEEILNADFIE